MAEEKPKGDPHEPRGLGEHNRAVTSERAHEQGWQLHEEERTQIPEGRPDYYGGKGYDYGAAADFGDLAVKKDAGDSSDAQAVKRAAEVLLDEGPTEEKPRP